MKRKGETWEREQERESLTRKGKGIKVEGKEKKFYVFVLMANPKTLEINRK